MKTALVTGASGYLGGHVARRLLAEGWRVVTLVRPGSTLAADLVDRVRRAEYDGTLASVEAAFAEASIDIVVHLASAVIAVHTADQLDAILDANVRFPTHLLEAMRSGTCKRFVNTGSFWQHCNSNTYVPVNLYAATKQAFEDVAAAYVENDGITVCTLVLYDTYGADDPRRKIVRLLVDAVGAADPLRMSPGEQVLDLTHAEDVARAFVVACQRLLATEQAVQERFRVSGHRLSLKELVECVEQVVGAPVTVALGALPYRVREIMVPIAEVMPQLPNWEARHDLATEIEAMIGQRRGTGKID